MARTLFIVMGFASHQAWAEGYRRYTLKEKDIGTFGSRHQPHEVDLEIMSGDRWKFRMMAAIAELESKILQSDYDVVVVDGMLDVTVLVALVKSHYLARAQFPPAQRQQHQQPRCPKFLVYMHENQLTTPFTSQDRDYNKENPTHWHYGMAHWRSLMVADGFLFNSHTHLKDFSEALPKVINEQCPRDSVAWHLTRCLELLRRKCTVLPYGLELDELEGLVPDRTSSPSIRDGDEPDRQEGNVPVILWNARLEEDKDPATFLEMLHQARMRFSATANSVKARCRPFFRLVVLGNDPSKDHKWTRRVEEEFKAELLFCGWCDDRSEYARWLRNASIVVSTARHETFGASIVESVYCGGAIPLLPDRLSYPEMFPSSSPPNGGDSAYFYSNALGDGVIKLCELLELVANHPQAHKQAVSRARDAVSKYRWDVMGPVYDSFFSCIADGDSEDEAFIAEAGLKVRQSLVDSTHKDYEPTDTVENGSFCFENNQIQVISDAEDPRVQLYRPKSLRNHAEYNRQLTSFRESAIEPAVHGGRRAMVRMLEAVSMGAKIEILSFLATRELAGKVIATEKSDEQLNRWKFPIYICDNQEVMNATRGQKLNAGDSILALVQFPMISDLDELIANPPILILENVRNAENVGSILRTAFCLGIKSVVASPTAWAALRDTRAARCSMGTMFYHRYYRPPLSSLRSTIQQIQGGGITVYGVEIGDTAVPVRPHDGPDRRNWAAVLGNEDTGLSVEVAAACDTIVFVPQAHGDSLNVGHAAAITIFELGRHGPIPEHDGCAACT